MSHYTCKYSKNDLLSRYNFKQPSLRKISSDRSPLRFLITTKCILYIRVFLLTTTLSSCINKENQWQLLCAMCVKERERERKTEKKTETETEIETERAW